jgi:hypothetical protein
LELVSNHPQSRSARPLTTSDRLFILYLNGRQLVSKLFKKSKSIADVKSPLSELSRVKQEEIKLYKFIHRELDDNLRVDDVADSSGPVHLAAFSQLPPFGEKKVLLALQEIGAPAFDPQLPLSPALIRPQPEQPEKS